jgi:hypothetical protein
MDSLLQNHAGLRGNLSISFSVIEIPDDNDLQGSRQAGGQVCPFQEFYSLVMELEMLPV